MPFYRWANYVVGENGFCVEGREKLFNNQNVAYFYKTTNQKKTTKVYRSNTFQTRPMIQCPVQRHPPTPTVKDRRFEKNSRTLVSVLWEGV